MTPALKFQIVSENIIKLCLNNNFPVPNILPSLKTDPCDFTSTTEIRLNIEQAGNIDPDYYAKHVFSHYLCNLEQTEISDKVADFIATYVDIYPEGR